MKTSSKFSWQRMSHFWDFFYVACERGFGYVWRRLGKTIRAVRHVRPARRRPVLYAECLEPRIVMTAQWANHVLGYSSQRSAGAWSAAQALGAPNTAAYGDLPTAWAPAAPAATAAAEEYLTLGFAQPVHATGVTVRETDN